MLTVAELLQEIDRLPAAEKWQLVRRVLLKLEREQATDRPTAEYRQFLRETYGSLRATPIERADQGKYEERESLE